MTLEEFGAAGGRGVDGALLALWWDAQGDWEKAHEVAQDVAGVDGAWVHAYLHRKEGDVGNAGYWYRRGGAGRDDGSLPKGEEGGRPSDEAHISESRCGGTQFGGLRLIICGGRRRLC